MSVTYHMYDADWELEWWYIDFLVIHGIIGKTTGVVQDAVEMRIVTWDAVWFHTVVQSVFLEMLQVFQPLLLEHFSYDELCALRLRVIELHRKRQEQEKFTWTECEKECNSSCNVALKSYALCPEKYKPINAVQQNAPYPEKWCLTTNCHDWTYQN